MKVIGFRATNDTKQYTQLITNDGQLLAHASKRSKSSVPGISRPVFTLEAGSVGARMPEDLPDTKLNNLHKVLMDSYARKKRESLSYTTFAFFFTEVAVQDHPILDKDAVAAISREISDKLDNKQGIPGVQRFYRIEEKVNAVTGVVEVAGSSLPEVTSLDAYKAEIDAFALKHDLLDANSVQASAKAPVVARKFNDIEAKVMRPNGEEYKPRELMGHTDVSLLRALREKNIPVRLAGPPGGGKTALAEAAFWNSGNGIITVSGHGDMTVANFVGSFIPRPHRQSGESEWMWVDGPLVRAMKEGKPFFVDEGTRIPTEVLNILFSVMDGRNVLRIDDRPDIPPVEAKEGFYVLMGYNPDTLGALGLDEALTSRFRVQINVYTDYETARNIGVPETAVKIAERMFELDAEDRRNGGDGLWVPQMRELITYRDIVNMGAGEDFAQATLLASCPRTDHLEELTKAIKKVVGRKADKIGLPTLGGMV